MARFAVILPAAGSSSRFQDKHYKKPFVPLAGKAVWLYSAERFLNRDDVKQVILVIAADDRPDFLSKFGANIAILGIEVVDGGATRSESVATALEQVQPDIDFVAVHDAARPCLVDEWVDRVFQAAEKHDAAILGTPVNGTLKRIGRQNEIAETVSREGLWEAQTPQVFRRELLTKAYASRVGQEATDDAQLVENTGQTVHIVLGSSMNLKITTREDLKIAEQMLRALPRPKLKGTGNPFADDDMWR